jgi:hypothetical protein
VVEAEEGARALDGVEGAEDGVQRLAVAGAGLEGEERRLGGGERVAALGEEVAEERGVEVVGEAAGRRRWGGGGPDATAVVGCSGRGRAGA